MKIVSDDSGLSGSGQPNMIDLPRQAGGPADLLKVKPAILPDDSGLSGSAQINGPAPRVLDTDLNEPVRSDTETIEAIPIPKRFGVFVNQRITTSTTAATVVTLDLPCRYVTVHAMADTYIQLGTSIDQIGSLIIEAHCAVRLPLQHNRSIALQGVTATGVCFITFHDEDLMIYTARMV